MIVLQTNSFKKVVKKLHSNQKLQLDKAIESIIANPLIGVQEAGDLSEIRVYKFNMIDKQVLLAYQFKVLGVALILLALGSVKIY